MAQDWYIYLFQEVFLLECSWFLIKSMRITQKSSILFDFFIVEKSTLYYYQFSVIGSVWVFFCMNQCVEQWIPRWTDYRFLQKLVCLKYGGRSSPKMLDLNFVQRQQKLTILGISGPKNEFVVFWSLEESFKGP